MSYPILEFTVAKVLFLPYEVFHILDICLHFFGNYAPFLFFLLLLHPSW